MPLAIGARAAGVPIFLGVMRERETFYSSRVGKASCSVVLVSMPSMTLLYQMAESNGIRFGVDHTITMECNKLEIS